MAHTGSNLLFGVLVFHIHSNALNSCYIACQFDDITGPALTAKTPLPEGVCLIPFYIYAQQPVPLPSPRALIHYARPKILLRLSCGPIRKHAKSSEQV